MALRVEEPPALTASSTLAQIFKNERWERSNCLCLLFMKSHINKSIRGSILETDKAKPFRKAVEEQFIRSDKALASTLMKKLSSKTFDSTEALKTTVYILNRVPSKAVFKTPFELWTGQKPSLSHLHIWGCTIEVRIYNPHIKKLDPRIISGFFIGYPVNSKGFKFYCPSNSPRIVESRNAKFLEDAEPSGSAYPRKLQFEKAQEQTKTPSYEEHMIVLREDQIDYSEQQSFQEQSTHEEQVQAEPTPSL
ncbi:hypothetical protein F0562_010965 [Nyssa sinensis]|uniref:Retroviral polymerase SH3-like domain-containing protein n=1 Tax=Nyssa sinensis TaxID=561372 RepID=A0A5J5A400_9ASTE|nr:hypothetical protein F0562_010965 [Nyssa sinensis]